MTKIKIFGIGILAVVLAVVITWFIAKPKNVVPVGAPGNMLAEQYDPYIQYNGGFNTALGITNSGTLTQSGGASLTSTLSVTGTTTITESVDGLVVGGTISTAATGTVVTVYSNTTGPKFCDSSTGYLYVKNNGLFAPSLIFSVGTTTAAGIASKNLVASTTVATTTTSLIVPTDTMFILNNGEVITAIFGDNVANASSTYFNRWSAEVGVWCQDISI